MMGPPPKKRIQLYEKPKKLSEVPHYLKQIIGGFFSRLFYIISLVWETNPFLMIAMVLLCIIIGIMPVAGAYITRGLINSVNDVLNQNGIVIEDQLLSSVKGTLATVAFFLLIQVLYYFVNRLLNRLQGTVDSIAGELVSNHIKTKIMNKAKTVDLASFDDPKFYEKLENANREAGMRPIHILVATFNLISNFISAISFFVILCTLGWFIPFIVLVVALPSAIVNYIFRNRNFWYMRRRSKSRRQMGYYSDVVTNKDLAKEMRLMDLSDTFVEKYTQTFKDYFKGIKKLILQETFWQLLITIISLVCEGVIFFYIAYHITKGHMQIGDYSLLAGALTSIVGYVSSIINSTAAIYEGTLFIDNLMTFMKEKPTIISDKKELLKPEHHTEHTIVFEHVCFRYPGMEKDTIKDLSFELKSGERVVLVGLNGAGKTTIIKLMTRLYDPTSGRILLDGHDIKDYDPRELYRLYGAIFQDFGKYALTVGENIAIGNIKQTPTEENLNRAAKMGDATFISSLDEGMNTPLMRYFEDEGKELSIGQWQKLCIARAFYADSDILILDEPTASLDAIAEQEIYDRFAELSENKLTVLVSHRLSSAVTASKILVVDGGKLVEMGPHKELMDLKGTYYRLFSTQAKHYREDDMTTFEN